MRKSRRSPKRFPMRMAPGQWLAIVMIVGIVLGQSRDFFRFDNGAGGPDWKVGQPLITLGTAHQGRSLAESRALALQLVNRDRRLNGLKPLVEDPVLAEAAQRHAQDMLDRNYYDHVTPEGKTPSDRFAALGGKGGAGENIMKMEGAAGVVLNFKLIEENQKGWMYSPGHRENLLLPDYTHLGYGIVVDSLVGKVYAVQNFTTR